ncbi:MAG: hypothetical protein L0206_19045 [Actinobacteria bacterium]|nr:hypothetical protein [Actinomycetota bacterium]
MRSLADALLTFVHPDAGNANQVGIQMPDAGVVESIRFVNGVQGSTAATVITVELNGVAVAGTTISYATSDVIGTKKTFVPTNRLRVIEGDYLAILSNGGTSGLMPLGVTVVLNRAEGGGA